VWSRFSNYVISYTFNWLVQTVSIIWFCCLATVRKAYLCWFGLVLSIRLFFVARQRPDILRHCSHVFLGAVQDSVRIAFLFLELFLLFYGNECTDHKVSATMHRSIYRSLGTGLHALKFFRHVEVKLLWNAIARQFCKKIRRCRNFTSTGPHLHLL